VKALTATEQAAHARAYSYVRQALMTLLKIAEPPDEDVEVAIARLVNWTAENRGRWVA